MIVEMSRVRVLAPRGRLYPVLFALQDFGQLHLAHAPQQAGIRPMAMDARDGARARALRRILTDIDRALALFPVKTHSGSTPGSVASPAELGCWARLARRTRTKAEELAGRLSSLEEERALLEKYRHLLEVFEPVLRRTASWDDLVAHQVVLRADAGPATVDALRAGLAEWLQDHFELMVRPLPTGEQALLILVPADAAARMEALLADSRVEEVHLPSDYAGRPADEALPAMARRLETLPEQIAEARRALEALASETTKELLTARAAVADRLAEHDAVSMVGATDHAVVIEGWVPDDALKRLDHELHDRFDGAVAVETVAREEWTRDDAPVVLRNPRLFRPFELLIRMMPLPRYGTIDPTPFVAVFFPMLFGIILGDAGYGAVLALLALVIHRRSKDGTPLRAAAEVAGPCAGFAIIFGILFGEMFGDLGRHVFGLHALLFDREEALVPFLGAAVALGFVHILIGLVLGAVSALRGEHRRHALGRGVTALLLVLIAAALLAAVDVLPQALFTPAVIGILIAFPVLVIAEGLVAPVELLSTIGHVLSYARVMAIGTASVMMAVVANRMTGIFGSVLVGALFALIFHLVNFALGLFSPAIHSLRLHYVEFFGTFYSPGGTRYQPFGHARASRSAT